MRVSPDAPTSRSYASNVVSSRSKSITELNLAPRADKLALHVYKLPIQPALFTKPLYNYNAS